MPWNDIIADQEFQALPDERKQRIANNYFRAKIESDSEYQALPEERKSRIRNNFMSTVQPKPDDSLWGKVKEAGKSVGTALQRTGGVGLNLPTLAPPDKEYTPEEMATKSMQAIKALPVGAYHGITREVPGMVGAGMQVVGDYGNMPKLAEAGKGIREWSKSEEIPEEYKGDPYDPANIFYQAGRMLGPSVVPQLGMYGAGKTLMMAGGRVLPAVGRGVMALRNVAPAGLFGLQQAQITKETAEKAGVEPGWAPLKTGLIEAAGEWLGTKYLGKVLGIPEEGKAITKPVKNLLLKTLGVETGTEFAQQFGEATVEQQAGIRPSADPLSEGLQTILPTAVMTLLTAGMGGVGRKLRQQIEQHKADLAGQAKPPVQDQGVLKKTEEEVQTEEQTTPPSKEEIEAGFETIMNNVLDAEDLSAEEKELGIKKILEARDKWRSEQETEEQVEEPIVEPVVPQPVAEPVQEQKPEPLKEEEREPGRIPKAWTIIEKPSPEKEEEVPAGEKAEQVEPEKKEPEPPAKPVEEEKPKTMFDGMSDEDIDNMLADTEATEEVKEQAKEEIKDKVEEDEPVNVEQVLFETEQKQKEAELPKKKPTKEPTKEKQTKQEAPHFDKEGNVKWHKWINDKGFMKGELYRAELFDKGGAAETNPHLKFIRRKAKSGTEEGYGFDQLAQMAYAEGLIPDDKPETLFNAMNMKKYKPAMKADESIERELEATRGQNVMEIDPSQFREGDRFRIQDPKTGDLEEYRHMGYDDETGNILIGNDEEPRKWSLDFGDKLSVNEVIEEDLLKDRKTESEEAIEREWQEEQEAEAESPQDVKERMEAEEEPLEDKRIANFDLFERATWTPALDALRKEGWSVDVADDGQMEIKAPDGQRVKAPDISDMEKSEAAKLILKQDGLRQQWQDRQKKKEEFTLTSEEVKEKKIPPTQKDMFTSAEDLTEAMQHPIRAAETPETPLEKAKAEAEARKAEEEMKKQQVELPGVARDQFATPEQEKERAILLYEIRNAEKLAKQGKTADERRAAQARYDEAKAKLDKLPIGMLTDKALEGLGRYPADKLIETWKEGVDIALEGIKTKEEIPQAYKEYSETWKENPPLTEAYFNQRFAELQGQGKVEKPAKVKAPWEMTREEFRNAVASGKLQPATGKLTPAEEAYEKTKPESERTPLGMGEAAGYSPADISHFYAARSGYGKGVRGANWDEAIDIGREEMIKDAMAEGKPVPESIRKEFEKAQKKTTKEAESLEEATRKKEDQHYRSGVNSTTDLKGYIAANVPVGVIAKDINDFMKKELLPYAKQGGKIFIDSGAFPAFTRGEKVVWEKVIKTYMDLAQNAPAGTISVVAPDSIGDQDETFRLQKEHAKSFLSIARDHGANIIVPIQKGTKSSSEAWEESIKNLQLEETGIRNNQVIAGIPSNKKAFSLEDLKNLISSKNPPNKFHLLGISPQNKNFQEIADTIRKAIPDAQITSDSNRLRAMVGEGRKITNISEDLKTELLADNPIENFSESEMKDFIGRTGTYLDKSVQMELQGFVQGKSEYDAIDEIPGMEEWYADDVLFNAFNDTLEKAGKSFIRESAITEAEKPKEEPGEEDAGKAVKEEPTPPSDLFGGEAKAETERKEKLESTGTALRRWWQLRSDRVDQSKGGTPSEQSAIIRKETDRSALLDIPLGENPTPRLPEFMKMIKNNIKPFTEWFYERHRRYRSKLSPIEYLNEYLEREDQVFRTEFGEKTLAAEDVVRTDAKKYIEALADLKDRLNGVNSIKEAAPIHEKFLRELWSGKHVSGANDIYRKGYYSWEANSYKIQKLIENENKPPEKKLKSIHDRPTIPLKEIQREELPEYRKGDITGHDLKAAFGFADITYGDYVTGVWRQEHSNKSFDALHDLAVVLGIDPKGIGLGGDLHLAIGALGQGRYAATYHDQLPHPDGGSVHAINLTKERGDGSLAHEFGHALDHYLRRTEDGRKLVRNFMNNLKKKYDKNHIDNYVKKFFSGDIFYKSGWTKTHGIGGKSRGFENAKFWLSREKHEMKGGTVTNFYRNAQELDKGKKGESQYWSKDTEMFARVFEAWVYDKLQGDSPYLVTDFVADGVTSKDSGYMGIPYPWAEERVEINQIIDEMVNNLEWTPDGIKVKNTSLTADKNRDEYLAHIEEAEKNLESIYKTYEEERTKAEIAKREEERAIPLKEGDRVRKIGKEMGEITAKLTGTIIRIESEKKYGTTVRVKWDNGQETYGSLKFLNENVVKVEPESANIDLQESINKMSDEAIDNLIDDVIREEFPKSPEQLQQEKKAEEGVKPLKELVQDEPSLKKIAKDFKDAGVEGIDEALKGLHKLFGGGEIKMFPAGLDKDAYEQAKPHFIQTYKAFIKAGNSAKEFVQFIVRAFGDKIKPYLAHFMKEVRDGRQIADDIEHAAGSKKTDTGADGGEGVGERPGLVVVNEKDIPKPKDYEYPYKSSLDEHQNLGVNLALTNFLDKKNKGFLLGDGTGTGKTRQILAIADQMQKLTGKPSLIITENKQTIEGSFTNDAKAMGIDLEATFEIGTYNDLSPINRQGKVYPRKAGLRKYGLVVFDEAHNLKNAESAKTISAGQVDADYKLYATATPMDRVIAAAYFMAEITGKTKEAVLSRIGVRIVTQTDKDGTQFDMPVPIERMDWAKIHEQLVSLRDEAIKNGAMIRREYPFYGDINVEEINLPVGGIEEQDRLDIYWQNRIQRAFSRNAKMRAAGERIGELSRWAEPLKIDYVYDLVKKDLEAGRSVVIVAERIEPTIIKGLGDLESPGTITVLGEKFSKDGIPFAKIYGTGKKSLEVEKFQSGKVKLAIMTPKSGGTGINLDDVIGDQPRSMYVMTPNFSGDVFEQIIGRVSRKMTKSPSSIKFINFRDSMSDNRRMQIIKKKVSTLKAIQRGEDLDKAIGLDEEETKKIDDAISRMFGGGGYGRSYGFMGTQEAYETLVADIRKAKDAMPKLIEMGQSVLNDGYSKFMMFRMRMQEILGDLWDRFKGQMLKIYKKASDANKKMGEEGFLKVKKKKVIEMPKSLDPTVEARYAGAKLDRGKIETLPQQLVKTWHEISRHFPRLDPKRDGALMNILRRTEAIPMWASDKAQNILRNNLKNLTHEELELFTRVLVLRDLREDIRSGLLTGELPFGYQSEAHLIADLSHYNAQITPEVQNALDRRKDFMRNLQKQLYDANILKGEVQRENYFHHQVLTYYALQRMGEKYQGLGTADFRMSKKGWQFARTGSPLDFNTDYVQSEYEVIAQALAQLRMHELMGEMREVADISDQVKQEAKDAGVDLKHYVAENYPDYTLWQPEKGNRFFRAYNLNEEALDRLLADKNTYRWIYPFDQLMEDNEVSRVLAMGAKKPSWVIPTRLAKTFNDMGVYKQEGRFGSGMRWTLNKWKQWTLLNPLRVVRYNLNNLSGDLDIAMTHPGILKYTWQAYKDLRHEIGMRGTPFRKFQGSVRQGLRDELDFWRKEDVVGGTMTAYEIPDISQKQFLKALHGDEGVIRKFWNKTKQITVLRENILRLAAARFFRDKLNSGINMYGASKHEEIDAIPEIDQRAAKLSRELIGDYGNLSKGGEWLRAHMIPFWSWQEINAPRYYRLLRNVKHEGQGIGRAARLTTAHSIATGTKLLFKMAILYGMINLWNHTMFPDEEDEMGRSGRRQLHLILGRNEDGSIRSLRFQGALSDALQWFGQEDFPQDFIDVNSGRKSWEQVFKEAYQAPVNRVMSGLRPFEKTVFEMMTGRSFYPNAFRMRPIRDKWDYAWKTFSLDAPFNWTRRIVSDLYPDKLTPGIPIRPGSTAGKGLETILTYRTDPEEAAYYDTVVNIYNFLEREGVEKPTITPTKKSNALYYYKLAMRYGDMPAAERWQKEYFRLGGNRQSIIESIQRSNPMTMIPVKLRRKFLDSLTAEDKDNFDAARAFWQKTYNR